MGEEEDDFLGPVHGASRDEQFNKALEFAKLYLVFIADERAKVLFRHWDETYAHKRTPVSAPITEYAANEAMRAFIQGIKDQIKLAQSDNR